MTVRGEVPDLGGRVAVVTGAARGIGREYARALTAAGAAVVVADVDAEGASGTVAAIEEDGGAALAVTVDVTDEASVEALADATLEHFGGVDVLVNNAAIWGGLRPGPMTEVPLEDWTRVMTVNVTGVWLVSRAFVPSLAEREGAIVNQSSIGAYMGGPNVTHYATSKGAVNALTRAMARDLGPMGVRVNAIAPGQIANEATLSVVSAERLEAMTRQQCLQRAGGTDDLTGPLLFLCSDAARFMTGQVLVVDGGLVFVG